MKRSGFSMIELVFVIVILGVLAAVAVPRFVATRTDAQVATARSDLASAQKAIVAKVFADNIDPTQSKAPDPNKPVAGQTPSKDWGDWIIEVAGLDGARWLKGGNPISNQNAALSVNANDGIQPVGNVQTTDGGKKGGCGMVLGINIVEGMLVFSPNNIGGSNVAVSKATNFCYALKVSFASSGGPGNKIIPLASTGTVEF
ncbi:type II secretion system protein [Helicobacter sp. 23-1045]